MPNITDSEYQEYRALRTSERLEHLRRSVLELRGLENDIDVPLKRSIAGLALLGCETRWSCCGFDYFGQPAHKAHEYGSTGICLLDTSASRRVWSWWQGASTLHQDYGNFWRLVPFVHYGDPLIYLNSHIHMGNNWPDTDCIHYSEPAVIAISVLEKFLEQHTERMADEVILRDTNSLFRSRFSEWQYPPLADWRICKAEFFGK